MHFEGEGVKGNGEKDNQQSCCACIYQAASGSCTAQTALLINPKQKNIENSSTDTVLIITQDLVAGTSKSCSLAVVCEYICAYKPLFNIYWALGVSMEVPHQLSPHCSINPDQRQMPCDTGTGGG